jgi:hypothetical protein
VTGTAKAFVDVNFAHAAVIVLSNADAKIKLEYTVYFEFQNNLDFLKPY